ncbi:MAG TPA: amidohydrolase [Thermomicrobiales bacterium]|nr:amidohydrolase [Thermomicrobiales bacterium]
MKSTLYTGGTILTSNPGQPSVEAVLTTGNIIRATGALDEVTAIAGRDVETVDLDGGCLLPGFNDNHTHPLSFGESLSQVDASPRTVTTLEGVLDAFRSRYREDSGDGWLQGRGYDDTRLDVQRHPTRDELDTITAERPILLVRTCGHLGVANTAALNAAGITGSTPDPQGGEIDRDIHGRPTGLLRETALKLVQAVIPEPTIDDLKRYARAAGEVFLSQGITSVVEASVTRPEQLSAYHSLSRGGELPFRVYTMHLIDDMLDTLSALGVQTGFGDAWVRIGPAKVFQDGSGGGRTAAMFDAYPGQPDNRGIAYYDQRELNERFEAARAAGLQLAAHAIGDRAITMILDAYQHALGSDAGTDHRARVEHCGMCTPEILHRLRDLKAFAAPQPTFVHYLGDSYLRNFTERQLTLAYPLHAFQQEGIPFSLSSDVPVTPCDSMMNLHAAVTRKTQDGDDMSPGQAITVESALRAYTAGGAFGSFEERLKGTLEPGKLADMVVLSDDPTTVDSEDIPDIRIRRTILNGGTVYEG